MMNTITSRKTHARIIAAVAGMAMVVGLLGVGSPQGAEAQQADAATIAALQAQVAALQAQVAAIQAGTQVQFMFTRNLTVGSTGEDVRQLQIFLNQHSDTRLGAFGPGSPGQETSYFGPLTRNAVVRFQAKYASDVLLPLGLTGPTGFWGPSSRAKANALITASQPPAQVPGDDDDDATDDDRLQGGAGSLDDVDFISSLNNEEVGEGSNDVEVAGLSIEADEGSDIEITAVRLDFDQGTADRDLRRYAENVSIWFDGERVALGNADDFDDDNNYTRTINLDSGAIIRAGDRAGDRAELIVAVSGLVNIDSADLSETWTVTVENLRFRDAQGAIITDSSTGDIGNARTFSFESFSSAADAQMRVRLHGNTPDAQIVNVDNTNDTNDVEMLRFTLEAQGNSDLRVRDLPIAFATGAGNTGDVEDIINNAKVTIDGNEFSENVTAAKLTAGVLVLDDLDYTIGAGDTVTVVVTVDVNDIDSSFVEGDTLTASYTSANRNATDVEDEAGDDLNTTSERTGTANGNEMTFYDEGIQLALVEADTSVNSQDGAGNDTAVFRIVYTVTPFDSSAFVPNSTTVATTTDGITAQPSSDGVFYRVDKGGTATVSGLSGVISAPSTSNANVTVATNGIEIGEEHTAQFTLSVTRTNSVSGDAGQYRMTLQGLTWDTSDQAHTNFYNYNLDDYRTNYVFIN